jgi:hypothetical protein
LTPKRPVAAVIAKLGPQLRADCGRRLLETLYVYCDWPALPVLAPVEADFVTHGRILTAGEIRVLNVEEDAGREVGNGPNEAEPAVYIEA